MDSYFANGRRRLHAQLKIEVFQALELRCRIFDEVSGSIKLKDLFALRAATLPFDINSEPTEAAINFTAPEVQGGIVLD